MSCKVYEIAVRFTGTEIKKEDLVSLRRFIAIPLGELNELVKRDKVIIGTLSNEKFYSGVKEMISLLDSFDSEHQIYSNDVKVDRSFLDDIALKVSNIKLSDIR
jgi:hypothetical protein